MNRSLSVRELSRTEEDVQQEQVRTGHHLRDLLRRYFPQMVELCPGIDEPWLWELIELAPTPAKAAKLTRARVEKLLRSHRIRRLTAEEIVAQQKAPPLRLAPGAVDAPSEHVILLLPPPGNPASATKGHWRPDRRCSRRIERRRRIRRTSRRDTPRFLARSGSGGRRHDARRGIPASRRSRLSRIAQLFRSSSDRTQERQALYGSYPAELP